MREDTKLWLLAGFFTLLLLLSVISGASAAPCQLMPGAYPPKPDSGVAYRRHKVTEGYVQRRLVERKFPAIVIGDSIAGMWPHELLEAMLGSSVLNAGRGGSTTLDWLGWLDEWDWSLQQPVVVYIVIGRNDMSYDICPAEVANSVVALIKKAKARFPGARIVWQNVIPAGFWLGERVRETQAVNELVAAQGPALGYGVMDAHEVIRYHCHGVKLCGLFYAGDDYQGTGPVHLGANGYEAIYRYGKVK